MYSTVWPYKCVRKAVYHERIPPDLSTKQSVVISYFVLPFPGKNLNFQSIGGKRITKFLKQRGGSFGKQQLFSNRSPLGMRKKYGEF